MTHPFETFLNPPSGGLPAAPHWWGVYKLEIAGLGDSFEETDGLELGGERLARIDSTFYERFQPDWLHLGSGSWRWTPERLRSPEFARLRALVGKCQARSDIADYIAFLSLSDEEMARTGAYAHVPILSEKYGRRALIAMNEGNPVCDILDPHGVPGFEAGMAALVESPDFIAELLYRLYEVRLRWMPALKAAGCHAYIGSETYVAADLISPRMFHALVFPALQMFYQGVATLGMIPIVYFLGDINPLLDELACLGARALMVEESKKSFTLDVVEIRRKLAPEMVLFGNVDSVGTLLHGNRAGVVEETRRQLEAARYGPFVVANGSPLCFGTPPENVEALIEAAHAG
jgi:hypothetical protein